MENTVQMWELAQIQPNPYQPRLARNEEKFAQLVASIEQHGLIQTPTGRRKGDHIELADGHQRLEAFRVLSEKDLKLYGKLPVVIKDLTDQQMADMAIEANEKREALNPIDLAKFFKRYLQDFKVTQVELAAKFGMTQGALANTMRLLDLSEPVQGMIISQEITATHGRELLKVKSDPKLQEALAKQAAKEKAPVAELQSEIARSVREKGRTLGDEGWPRPLFDTKGCKNCEYREMIVNFNKREIPFCLNPSCWDKKQKAIEDKKAEEERKKFANLAKKDIVDLSKLDYGKYQKIYAGEKKWAEQNCKGCEFLKQAKERGDRGITTVCLKPNCYRKKKGAITREKNKKLQEEYEKLLAEVEQLVDILKPPSSVICILLLKSIMDYDQAKVLAGELGLETKGYKVREELEERLETLDIETLRWYVIQAAVLRRYGNRYRQDNKEMAAFVESLKHPVTKKKIKAISSIEEQAEPKKDVTDAEVCQMCHLSSGCKTCCKECKEPCNGQQACGLTDTMERKLSRWESFRKYKKSKKD